VPRTGLYEVVFFSKPPKLPFLTIIGDLTPALLQVWLLLMTTGNTVYNTTQNRNGKIRELKDAWYKSSKWGGEDKSVDLNLTKFTKKQLNSRFYDTQLMSPQMTDLTNDKFQVEYLDDYEKE